jgi:hypothetical protein
MSPLLWCKPREPAQAVNDCNIMKTMTYEKARSIPRGAVDDFVDVVSSRNH